MEEKKKTKNCQLEDLNSAQSSLVSTPPTAVPLIFSGLAKSSIHIK